ncbi:hypothetical protein AGDE_17012 [Angomonas deanei]|uniref:Uncharacterized protein n=1 Tax=Angomonas deanei TaxID=59799 RepID=A0A7G2CNG7_9TRYP|nr:hypothetical protein AGDE_17012 [Angomonas deanei]CAD2220494.1 hypothetical protein, conserved [Angomonas deanei]|eukprot:EPY15691.1 hypothetical protein AGDE_17012 [Angomonas deanei]
MKSSLQKGIKKCGADADEETIFQYVEEEMTYLDQYGTPNQNEINAAKCLENCIQKMGTILSLNLFQYTAEEEGSGDGAFASIVRQVAAVCAAILLREEERQQNIVAAMHALASRRKTTGADTVGAQELKAGRAAFDTIATLPSRIKTPFSRDLPTHVVQLIAPVLSTLRGTNPAVVHNNSKSSGHVHKDDANGSLLLSLHCCSLSVLLLLFNSYLVDAANTKEDHALVIRGMMEKIFLDEFSFLRNRF